MADFSIVPAAVYFKHSPKGNLERVRVGFDRLGSEVAEDGKSRAILEGKSDDVKSRVEAYNSLIDKLGSLSGEGILIGGSYQEFLPLESRPYRWAAGGGILTLSSGEAVFLRRDSGAPSYPGCLTIPAGLSGSLVERDDPRKVCLREILEEILFYDSSGNIYVPNLRKVISDTDDSFLEEVYNNSLASYNRLIGPGGKLVLFSPKISNKSKTVLELIDTSKMDLNEIPYQKYKGFSFCIDPKTRGVDAIYSIQVPFSRSDLVSGKIKLCDGEKDFRRDLFIVEPRDMANFVKSGGNYLATVVEGKKGSVSEGEYSYDLTPSAKEGIVLLTDGKYFSSRDRLIGDLGREINSLSKT